MNQHINRTFDEVCKDIIEKKSVDYVGAYELIKHEKLKRKCFNSPNDWAMAQEMAANRMYSIQNPTSWPQ